MRKLATIRRVREIKDIPGADNIFTAYLHNGQLLFLNFATPIDITLGLTRFVIREDIRAEAGQRIVI